MNVPGPGAQVIRIATPATELRRRGIDLAVGTRVEAQVLVVNGDRAVVSINGQSIAASTSTPLREGQLVQLQVDRADSDTLVLRLVEAVPGRPTPRELPPGAILPRTPEDIARAIRAIGLPVDDTTLLAADALLARGLPLSHDNVSFVTRNLPRFRLEPQQAAEALAIARSLDLPASDSVIAMIAAAREAGTMPHAERLAEVAALAEQVRGALPAPGSDSLSLPVDASEALIAAVRDALASAEQIGRVGGGAEADSLIAARLSAMLAAMEFGGLLDVGARMTGELADLLHRMPTGTLGELGRVVATPLVELAAALEKEIASVIGFLTDTEVPSWPASRLSELTAQLSQTLGDAHTTPPEDAPPMTHEQAERLLASLRQVIREFSATLTQESRAAVPMSLRPMLDILPDLPARLLGRVSTASAAIDAELPPEAAAAVSRLSSELQAVVLRQAQHPADRVAQLSNAVEQAIEALEPAAVRSPTVRALLGQLLGTREQLASPAARAEPAPVLEAAAMRLASALRVFRESVQARVFALVSALESRLYADMALSGARMAAAYTRYAAGSLPQVQMPSSPVFAEPIQSLPPHERSALQHIANQAIRDSGQAIRRAIGTIRRDLAPLNVPGAEGILQAVEEAAVGPSSPHPAEVARVALPQLDVIATDRAMEQRVGPAVAAAVRSLQLAVTSEATRDLAEGAARLARVIELASTHPTDSTRQLADVLRASVEAMGRSLENRLLAGDVARGAERDLRAAIARIEHSLERLTHTPETGQAPRSDAAQLLSTVTSVRQVLEGQQLLNAQAPRPAVPSHVYVHVPVVVDGRRFEAHIKVQRDGDGATRQIDEDNARIALRLDTDSLGTVTALLSMHLGRLSVDFSLDDPQALDFVRAHIEELDAALERTGLPVDRLMAKARRTREPDDFDRLGEPAYQPYTLSILA